MQNILNKFKARDIAFLVFIIGSLIMAGWAANNALAVKRISIKFPHSVAVTTPKGQGAEHFRQLVEERLGDRVVVEVYPSASLMTDDTSIEALAFGEIQLVAVPLSKLDRLTKRYQVFDLPFLFSDIAAVERFQASDEGRSLLNVLDDKGIKGLGYWHNGMKQFGAPRAMRLPEDAEGMKFRIMESDVLQAQILAIGGNPQKMPFSEVYHALQTGAIDAQENSFSNMYSSHFFEVQDYIMNSNHGFIGYLFATNSEFWDDLPDDIKIELEAIAAETSIYVNQQANAINDGARAKIEQSGVSQVLEFTPAELQNWRNAMAPVWQEFKENIGEETLNSAIAASQATGEE